MAYCVYIMILLKVSFCLRFRVFLPSFEKERRKMLAKRRKKARGSTERLAENSLKSRSEFWVQKLPQRSAEYFGLFEEKFRLCRKEIFEGDTRICSHKVHGITVLSFLQKCSPTLRIFGVFCALCLMEILLCFVGEGLAPPEKSHTIIL